MEITVGNILLGLLVAILSLVIARQLEQKWLRILIVVVGIFLAGIISIFPQISYVLNSPKIPSDAEILASLYGDDINIKEDPGGGSVYVVEELSDIEREQFNYAAQVRTEIFFKQRGWENDPRKVLILTQTGPPDCCDRSRLPVLGGAILYWENDSWYVDIYQKLITSFGSFDNFPEAKLVEIGSNKTAIVIQDTIIENGISQTWDLLISDIEGSLKIIANIVVSSENTQSCHPIVENEICWEYDSEYDFIRGDKPRNYDIKVTTSGTKVIEGELVPVDESYLLVFDGSSYK